jgi:hypothetical protein
MNPDSQALLDYLDSALPVETPQEEIEYACQHIFVTTDFLPKELQKHILSKENIAEAFSFWSQLNGKSKIKTDDWIELQMSILNNPEGIDTTRPLPFKTNQT